MIQIKDTEGNEYGRAKDIVGEKRMAFTPHVDAAFDVCFENQLNARRKFLLRSLSLTAAHSVHRRCDEPGTTRRARC